MRTDPDAQAMQAAEKWIRSVMANMNVAEFNDSGMQTIATLRSRLAEGGEECSLCNGMGFIDGIGMTCPHCDGQGIERFTHTAAVQAALERAAQIVEPKGARPCDCERCDCHNSGDAWAVAVYDEAKANADAIRALKDQA